MPRTTRVIEATEANPKLGIERVPPKIGVFDGDRLVGAVAVEDTPEGRAFAKRTIASLLAADRRPRSDHAEDTGYVESPAELKAVAEEAAAVDQEPGGSTTFDASPASDIKDWARVSSDGGKPSAKITAPVTAKKLADALGAGWSADGDLLTGPGSSVELNRASGKKLNLDVTG